MAFKMHEPIGEAIYGPLLVRLSLGAYFAIAGLTKLDNHQAFIAEAQKLNLFPGKFGVLYAIVLPYLEIAAGALLVIGIWTTLAALILALIIVSFIIPVGLFPSGGRLFNKDVILLCGVLSLLYTGAGALSVDRFRKT